MPGHAPREILAYPGPIATQAATKTVEPYPSEFIKPTLIQISNYLIGVVSQPTLFGRPEHEPFRPNLRTLHDRLYIGRISPSPIAKDNKRLSYVKKTLGHTIRLRMEDRELQDFEDIYYALIARLQEMRQTLNAWLASDFISASAPLFEDGPTINVFHNTLCEYWSLLEDPAFVRAMDEAVRGSRVDATVEGIKELVETGQIGIEDAAPCLRGLYDSWDRLFGLDFKMLGWSPAMIAVYLEEKYRLVLRLERESEEKEVREMRRKVKSGKSVEELKIRKGGKHVRSQRRSSNEARRNLVLKAGPAKAVRFIVDHKARGEVQDADKTSSAEVIDYDTRPMSPERPFVLRGSLPKHNSLQTIKDLDDFTAEREQRALQANLHLDIERQLYIDAAYSHRDVTASRTSSPCQQSSGRIENVGSWEHMSYDRHY